MRNLPFFVKTAFKLSTLAVAVSSVSAFAQDARSESEDAAPRVALEEVIVTAQKREQSLRDTAASINVVDSQALEDFAIFDFQQLESLTAGLTLDRISGNEQAVSLRGVKMPAFAIAQTTNTVDYYLNEVPQKITDAFSSLYDVGQIEVLKGPQGTLRGRLSPSGAITLTTKKPSFDGIEGFIDLSYSDNGLRANRGAINLPISDTLAIRVAGLYEESNDNNVLSVPLGQRSGHETESFRATALWEPNDALRVEVMGQTTEEDASLNRGIFGTGTEAAGEELIGRTIELEDELAFNTGPNISTIDTDIFIADIQYSFGNHRLTSVSSYQESLFFDALDLDFTGNGLNRDVDPPVAITSGGLQSVDRTWDDESVTQELRFENIDYSVWKYVAGFYYEEKDSFFRFDFPANPSKTVAAIPSFETLDTIEDIGIFTNHLFQVTDSSAFEFGVRYSEREVTPKNREGEKAEFDSFTGNASFKHDFTRDLMGYVSVGTSFRPGSGPNVVSGNPIPSELIRWDEEDSTSYEVGIKGSLYDNRVDYNLAAFYQDFSNYIDTQFRVACTGNPTTDGSLAAATLDGTFDTAECLEDITFNGDMISTGIEGEIRALITPSWDIQILGSYAEATYDDANIPCNDFNGDGVPDAEGAPRVQAGKFFSTCITDRDVGNVPEWNLTLNSQYTFPAVFNGEATPFVRVIYDQQGEVFFPQTDQTLDTIKRVDLFSGLTSKDGSWEAQLFLKNVFDDQEQDSDGGAWFIDGEDTGFRVGTVTRGREFGAKLIYRFGS